MAYEWHDRDPKRLAAVPSLTHCALCVPKARIGDAGGRSSYPPPKLSLADGNLQRRLRLLYHPHSMFGSRGPAFSNLRLSTWAHTERLMDRRLVAMAGWLYQGDPRRPLLPGRGKRYRPSPPVRTTTDSSVGRRFPTPSSPVANSSLPCHRIENRAEQSIAHEEGLFQRRKTRCSRLRHVSVDLSLCPYFSWL